MYSWLGVRTVRYVYLHYLNYLFLFQIKKKVWKFNRFLHKPGENKTANLEMPSQIKLSITIAGRG